MDLRTDPRFAGIEPFENKVWLSSPTMHGTELAYMKEAYDTNWMSTVGKNINEVEAQMAEYIGVKHAVALSAGTAALHLATKLAGEKIYGQARPNAGTLDKHPVLLIYEGSVFGTKAATVAVQQSAGCPISA